MALLNLLLDLVALVLGLSVLGIGSKGPAHRAGTLLGNLKPAETRRPRGWTPLAGLVALLFFRPLLYAPIADVLGTVPEWSPVPASVPFRPDYFGRLLAFSVISFLWTALEFLAWMILLSALARACREPGNWSRFFQETLGPLARIPVPVAALLPTLAAAGVWFLGYWPLHWIGVLPEAASTRLLSQQAVLVACGLWISTRWLLVGLLLLRLLNTYVYLGAHPFWDFVHQVGGVLLTPLRWIPLQIGKLDFAPVLASGWVLALGWGAERGLIEAYLRLRP